jgi:5-methylcytosine-specific restriction endonuclease McrA
MPTQKQIVPTRTQPSHNARRKKASPAAPPLRGTTPLPQTILILPGSVPAAPAPDFDFNLNDKRHRVSDEALLDQLRAFAATRAGRPFTQAEFKAWPDRRCSPFSISRRLGSWRKALAAAGIQGANVPHYEPLEMIQRLEKAWRALGRRPGVETLPIHGDGVTVTPFRRHWGTFMRACTLFVQFKRGQISLQQLLRPHRRPALSPLRPHLRWRVLNRDGHRCQSCGRSAAEKDVRLEVDHIIPRCAGGPDDYANLQTLCHDCNRGKGGKSQRAKRRTGRTTYAASTAA